MSIEDDDLEAAILFPKVAHAMAELVKKCHGHLGQFARLEAERLRHQERANKEAIINSELNAEIDRIQDEWKREQEAFRIVIGDTIHYLENQTAYSHIRRQEILDFLRGVYCLPNPSDNGPPASGGPSSSRC